MHDLALYPAGGASGTGEACLFGLSLCSGAGGLDLGLTIAVPGYRAVGHVERETYAAATLVARMEDASLDRAPLWDDVATFDGRPWRGAVDIVTAGYPCQPFSVAGKRRGADDPRHMWNGPLGKVFFQTARHTGTVRSYVRPVSAVWTAGLDEVRDANG